MMSERLDMLPLDKQVGFFSDAYCVEWVYGKAARAAADGAGAGGKDHAGAVHP